MDVDQDATYTLGRVISTEVGNRICGRIFAAQDAQPAASAYAAPTTYISVCSKLFYIWLLLAIPSTERFITTLNDQKHFLLC